MSRHHQKIVLGFSLPLAIAIIAGITLVSLRAGEIGEQDQQSPAAPRNPYGIYSPGNLDEVPFESRSTMIDALGAGSYAGFQDFNIRMIQEMGVSWARVDFYYDGNRFIEHPYYVEKLRASGFEVVGSARVFDKFAPTDLTTFESGLRHLIKRYPWIKVWQVGNEPNISMTYPEDYPRLFLAGSHIVRETCPSCKVMLAGIAARYPTEEKAMGVYRLALASIATHTTKDYRPFDIFDLHFYGYAGSEEELASDVQDYRNMLGVDGFSNIEIWMTESATHTGRLAAPDDAPVQTESEQAAELVRRFVTLLGAGLDRVSWARPYENYRYGQITDGYYDNAALIYNGLGQEEERGIRAGTRKESWFAYQNLIAMTKGYNEIIYHGPGMYEFSFGETRRPVFVIWNPGLTGDQRQTLPPAINGRIRVTDMLGTASRAQGDELIPGPEPVFVEPD